MPITVSGTLPEVLCFLLKWKEPFLEIIKQSAVKLTCNSTPEKATVYSLL